MSNLQGREQKALTEAEVEAFLESYSLFNDTLCRLEHSYRVLEGRFDSLNQELEETNRRLQESLSEKGRINRYLTDILESLGGGVVAVDSEGFITLFSRAASEILGLNASDVVGHPYSEVVGDCASDILHTLATGESARSEEKVLTRSDGRQVPVRFNTARVQGDDGEVEGAVETFEDISKLKELTRQVSRVSTLTALGEMAATVAHEIRNPLGGIGGFAGLLERDLSFDDPRRRLVKKVIEGVESLNRMVTNLLNYTRPLQLNKRPVDLVQVVEDSIGFFEIDAGNRLENVELVRKYSDSEVSCNVDPEQIQQIMLNLLHNAVQVMPSGGCVKIGLSEVEGSIDSRTSLDTQCVSLSVSDSGIGMTEEVKTKLFMPFFTTKEDGNGLGLATAKKVIEAHGGEIQVESELDRASVFTIFIPKSH